MTYVSVKLCCIQMDLNAGVTLVEKQRTMTTTITTTTTVTAVPEDDDLRMSGRRQGLDSGRLRCGCCCTVKLSISS